MTRFLLPLLLLAACAGTSDKADTSEPADADTDTDTDADTDADTDTDTAPDGGELFSSICAGCHGTDGRGTYSGPDLTRELDRLTDQQIVRIILEGKENMPAQDVTEEEAQAVVDWMRTNL